MKLVNNIKLTWKYTKDQKWKIIKYAFLHLLNAIIGIIIPIISAKMIVALTSNMFFQLITLTAILFVVDNLRNLVEFVLRYYGQIIYRESFTKIQIDLGENILKLTNNVIDKNNTGVFMQRLTNDTSRLADIFNIFSRYLSNIIADIGIFVAVFIINKLIFVFFVITTVVIYFVDNIALKKFTKKDDVFRKKQDEVSGFTSEMVRGIRDIKMLNAEDSFMKEFKKQLFKLNKTRYDMQDVSRKYDLLIAFFLDLRDLLLICILVVLVSKNYITVAIALVVYNYSGNVRYVTYDVENLLEKVKDFNLSASRIFSIMNSNEFEKEKFGKKHLDKVNGDFEFQNVTFAYEKKKVLKNLSFKVDANSTVAFVGKSGAGKTTIFNLLCKMYDDYSGKIFIDGIDINELDKDSIRGNITIISQNPYIFNMSIKDNLKLVKKDLTDKEMKEACKTACLDDFIKTLPNGYDTIIGEGGVNLSGGQKQRLAIARALVQKTEIILFDEATSALDNETQEKIRMAIDNMKSEYTILIIAHRLSTVIGADKIMLLDDGKIECVGTHDELLKNSDKYRELYEVELIEDEKINKK